VGVRARDIPNLISVIRIFLTLPIVWLMLEHRFGWVLFLFAVAGISDALDGYLAKHYGWRSRLGGLLDPLADKVLLVSCFLSLGWLGFLPVWLVLLVLLRDLVIVTGALVYNFTIAELEAEPSLISKFNTLIQILLVLTVVLNHGLLPLPALLLETLVWLTLLTTLLSGGDYVWEWSRKAAHLGGRRRG
jgi:cardiolipin synthase (CMP-forming)